MCTIRRMTSLRYGVRGGSSMFNPNRSMVSDSLASRVLGADYVHPRVKLKPADPRHPGPHKNVTHKHPDKVVLEVRRLYEQCNWPTRDIITHLNNKGWDVSMANVTQWIGYISRKHLEPSKNAMTYL